MSTITATNQRNGAQAPQATPKAQAVVEAKPNLIRRRAYEIFQARNGGPGDHVSDWVQAERELNAGPPAAPVVARTAERRGRTERSEADV